MENYIKRTLSDTEIPITKKPKYTPKYRFYTDIVNITAFNCSACVQALNDMVVRKDMVVIEGDITIYRTSNFKRVPGFYIQRKYLSGPILDYLEGTITINQLPSTIDFIDFTKTPTMCVVNQYNDNILIHEPYPTV